MKSQDIKDELISEIRTLKDVADSLSRMRGSIRHDTLIGLNSTEGLIRKAIKEAELSMFYLNLDVETEAQNKNQIESFFRNG